MSILSTNSKLLNFFYLSGLSMMLIRHHIPVISPNVYFIGFFLCLLYLILERENKNAIVYKRWTFVYIGFFLLSFLWSIKPRTSIFVLVVHLLPIVVLSLASLKYLTSYEKLNNILIVVFFSSLAMLCYLVTNIDDLIGARLGVALNEPGTDNEDILWNANVIGMTLCFSLYAGWIVFMSGRYIIYKILFIFVALMMFIAILLTGSRKTLLMLFIPISLYLFKKARKRFLLSITCFSIVIILLYYLVMNVEPFYSIIGTRVEEMIAILSGDETGREDDSRYYLIQYGLKWWQNNPILGVGINCYRVLSNATPMFYGKNFYAHNNYIELLVDVGVFGLFLYYVGHYYLVKESIKISTSVTFWIFTFVIVILILDMAYVSYYDLNNQLMLAVLFSVIGLEKKITFQKHENC